MNIFPSGGTGPLLICSDCYDNANIYSRTREYCPYAYLADDEPLERGLSGIVAQLTKEPYGGGHTQHEGTALESLVSQQDTSVFLASHDKKLGAHSSLQPYGTGEHAPDLEAWQYRPHPYKYAYYVS